MMRVVVPRYVLFKKECWYCGCVFEYTQDDIDIFAEDVTCPCCKKRGNHDAIENGRKREAQND